MDSAPRKPAQELHLGSAALERITQSLSDLYHLLYDERPADARSLLTGNMLAFVFEGGLTVADEWLLGIGRDERVREFRTQFFEAAGEEMTGVVTDLTGLPVTYSFYGFDPRTRTTHAIFVLDLGELDTSEERQAVLNWSEQVRRNARRLRKEHHETREVHEALKKQIRSKREEVRRESDERARRPSDDS